MRRRSKALLGLLALTATAVGVAQHRRALVAAYRAFRAADAPEGLGERPAETPLSARQAEDGSALDRQLAADFLETSGLDAVVQAERLSDLAAADLPVPITRRTQRFLRFFTQDPRGRRAFEHLYRRSGRYRDELERVLREAGLPLGLVWLVAAESSFEPGAVSPAKAAGLWQLMPGTAEELGLALNPWVDERRDVTASSLAAAQQLGRLHRDFGAWDLALAAYNMGPNALRQAMAELARRRAASSEPPGVVGIAQLAHEKLLPRETADYVPKVTALALVASNLSRFGFERVAPDAPLRGSPVLVPSETHLATVAKAAGITEAVLRDYNPELLGPAVPPGPDYELQLPPSQLDRALATLPVYLDEAQRQAEGLEGLAPATFDEPVEAPGVPMPLMVAWLDGLVASPTMLSGSFAFAHVPLRLGHQPLMQLGGVSLLPAGLEGLGPWSTWAGGVSTTVGGKAISTTASLDTKRLDQALGFLDAASQDGGPTEALGHGVVLRLDRDPKMTRVAITVRVSRGQPTDLASAPLTAEAQRDASAEERFTEVVRPVDVDVGLSLAVARLGLLMAERGPRSGAALRAELNRHRRVALAAHPLGEAWLALGDAMFPPGHAAFGRLLDPRGPDGAWLGDRLLLSERRDEGAPQATLTVAGHFDAEQVRGLAARAVAGLGMGAAGQRPPLADGPRAGLALEIDGLETPHHFFGFRLAGLDAPSFGRSLVALELLAGRHRSALREALIDGELAARYELSIDRDWGETVAVVVVQPLAGVSGERIAAALRRAVDDLVAEGPTGIQLAYAQAMVRAELKKQRQLAQRPPRPGVAPDALRVLVTARPGMFARWLEQVDAVRLADARRALREELVDATRLDVHPRRPLGEVAKR
ncbi:MAG: transglycosylase SLT domain-containing protein [Polyangiaceae bacterium]